MWSGIGGVKGGIQINMRKLNSIHIGHEGDGKKALVGGGTLVQEYMDALFAAGKQSGKYKAVCHSLPPCCNQSMHKVYRLFSLIESISMWLIGQSK